MAQPLFPVDRLPHMRFARGYIASSQSGRWVIALVFGSLLSPVSVSLAHAQILGQIEMRDSATADDYLCWSPVQARIRLATSQPADVSVTVKSVPLGPAGGQVQFMAATSAPITRATFTPVPELALTLPKDGGWVRFLVAGRRASRGSKDALIRAELPNGAGAIVQLPVMVRVRKDAETLTTAERAAFLRALAAWKTKPGLTRPTRFEDYYTAHDDAFSWGIHSNFGTQVSNFLPWHRAFLLNFERELQQIDPAVALPYWRFDVKAPGLFSAEFLGALVPGSTEVRFSNTNPIRGWSRGQGEALRRANQFDQQGPVSPNNLLAIVCRANEAGCSPQNAVQNELYRSVTDRVELNYHNGAHAGVLGWLGAGTSPSDPLFFLLHANVDRGSAHWQESRTRFVSDGQNEGSYTPTGRYPGATIPQGVREGLYALDPMWPWGPKSGDAGTPNDPRDDWLPYRFPFPSVPGMPFSAADPPTPAKMIDYMNVGGVNPAHGSCYDDFDFEGKDPRTN
jgi:tyrosinase